MIIQIDHLAISTINIEEQINTLKLLGYNVRFIEHGIKNPGIKRKLMKTFRESHSICLLTMENNLGIELIDHGHIHEGEDYIIPILENMQQGIVAELFEKKNLGNHIFTKAKIPYIDNLIYIQEDVSGDNFRFNKFVVGTKDFIKSCVFWECFGFKTLHVDGDLAYLEFNSFYGKNVYKLYLINNGHTSNRSYLDSNVFNSIAFVTTSATNERMVLKKKGFEVTEIEQIALNNKVLDIFFAIGPNRELVELIGIHNLRLDKAGGDREPIYV